MGSDTEAAFTGEKNCREVLPTCLHQIEVPYYFLPSRLSEPQFIFYEESDQTLNSQMFFQK